MTASLSIPVGASWDLAREVRALVAERLNGVDEDIRAAAVVAASELVENAIKHGGRVDGPPSRFELIRSESSVSIRVASGIRTDDSARGLVEHIHRIEQAPNKHALYHSRMRELSSAPHDPTQLGLYRIVAECGFELASEIHNDELVITASKGLG